MKTNTVDRDWREDFGTENGNYMNSCHACGEQFFGHKRRVTCRVCAHRRGAPHGYFSPSVERVVAWYDLWVGFYWDRKDRWLYVLPVPCLGFRVKVPPLKSIAVEILQRLIVWRSGLWVYAINDYDWWVARSAAEAIADYTKTTGIPAEEALGDSLDGPEPLTGEEMSRLLYTYDEGAGRKVRFRDRLFEIVYNREAVPGIFASTEY